MDGGNSTHGKSYIGNTTIALLHHFFSNLSAINVMLGGLQRHL